MRSVLPLLDMHAHIDLGIPAEDLRGLGAVVFAATRSMQEAAVALERKDETVIWGVGSHPALTRTHSRFDSQSFRSLVERTSYVGEVGLDGSSKINLASQARTLRGVLAVLQELPRIASLHSQGATHELLAELARTPIRGAVLHWWLGDEATTKRAIELGCYFSVNTAMLRRPDVLCQIPLIRLLTETDHPFGDRFGPRPHRPGAVEAVEAGLARLHGTEADTIRRQAWSTLARITAETGVGHLLPRRIRSLLVLSTQHEP